MQIPKYILEEIKRQQKLLDNLPTISETLLEEIKKQEKLFGNLPTMSETQLEEIERQEELLSNLPNLIETQLREIERQEEMFRKINPLLIDQFDDVAKAFRIIENDSVKLFDFLNNGSMENIIKAQDVEYANIINREYGDLEIGVNKDDRRIEIKSNRDDGISIDLQDAKNIVLINDIIDDITFEECADFLNYIANFPMLGAKHKIGKKIYNAIMKSRIEKINSIRLFRVRKSTDVKQIPYTRNEMFEPQYKSPKQNRFSMIGLNPLYLSDSLETALTEIGIRQDSKYTTLELELKNEMNMLNIVNEEVPLFDFCHKRSEDNTAHLSIEYLFPNFIADCTKECAFDGIIYRSIHNSTTRNYVFFEAGRRDFKAQIPNGINY